MCTYAFIYKFTNYSQKFLQEISDKINFMGGDHI